MPDKPHSRAAARELPALFDALVEAAPNGILRVSADGTITFANRHAGELFGYEPAELVGLGIEALVPERLQRVHAALRTGFVHDPSVRPMGHGRDLFARRRDGSELPIEVSLGPSRDEHGEVTTTVIVVDVTERKRAEAELRRRASRERAVADLGEQALKGMEIGALMERAARVAADGLGVRFAKVLELRPGEGDLVLRAGVGWRAAVVGKVGLPLQHEAQAAYTLRHDRPVVVEDLRSERRFRAAPVRRDHHVVSGATVVIRAGSAQSGSSASTATSATTSPRRTSVSCRPWPTCSRRPSAGATTSGASSIRRCTTRSPACPIARCSWTACASAAPAPPGGCRSGWPSSTSTPSRPSTTASGTPPATSSCAACPRAWSPSCAARTRWRARAPTSSSSSSTTCRRRGMRSPSPTASRSASRSRSARGSACSP